MDDKTPQASLFGVSNRNVTLFLFGLTLVFAVALFRLPNDKATIALCLLGSGALAVFWPLVAKVDNLKIGASGLELSQRVEEAKSTADDAADKAYRAVETITRFVFNSMPQPTFRNLTKIDSMHFGKFDMTESFRQELRYLRDSGYIATSGVHIGDIPASGDELSEYVFTTDLGKEFIARRRETEIRPPKA